MTLDSPALRTLAGACVLAVLAACAGPGGTDRVEIKSIQGGRHAETGLTLIAVTVNYRLAASPEGELALGFDIRESGSYRMVAHHRVPRGSGTVTLVAKIDPLGQRTLTALVNLSEYPHPRRWQPLTQTQRVFVPPADGNASAR